MLVSNRGFKTLASMENNIFIVSEQMRLRGVPWMSGAYCVHEISRCKVCGATTGLPTGKIELRPDPSKGSFWADAIGSGGGIFGPFFSLSVKLAFDELGFRYGSAIPANVMAPYPKRLQASPAPQYFYLCGEKGAKYDFEASGHRIRSICASCGSVKKDPSARPTSEQLVPNTWNGSDLFYTELSLDVKFCTRRVLELAAQRKWKGLRFVPLERAYDASFPGIDYLNT